MKNKFERCFFCATTLEYGFRRNPTKSKYTNSGGKKGRSGPPGNQNNLKHGYYALVKTLKKGDLVRRTAIGRYQKEKEAELATALSGDPSPQQQWLITDAVRVTLYLASIDSYLVGLKSAVRKGKLHPVLRERGSLAAHVRENLKALGLHRRMKTPSLTEILAADSEPEPPKQRRRSESQTDHGCRRVEQR